MNELTDHYNGIIAGLRAENAGLSRSLNASVAELDELIAERDKLRAALEWVEQNSNEPDIAGYAGRAAALNEEKK